MHKLLFVAFVSALALPSVAQTGRIAHFSHSGRVALATGEVADNFGISYVEQEWKDDSIITVSRTTVEHRGQLRMRYVNTKQGAGPWERHVASYPVADKQMLQNSFPNAVVENTSEKKKPSGRKPAGHVQPFPKRPFQYSYWRGLAGIAALGAVGWLLGNKRSA